MVKKMLIAVLIFLCASLSYGQNIIDCEDTLSIKIKEMNTKVHEYLADGNKNAAFAYMDSIKIISNGKRGRTSSLYRFENIEPKKDKLSEILGIVQMMKNMARMEMMEKKALQFEDEK
ncbi:MAG: hypothetical protein II939_05175 [Bacteroidales bacterium]|nr:hypothetical protein [Bacteroidales bacterium]